jgi:hypothetical protein
MLVRDAEDSSPTAYREAGLQEIILVHILLQNLD